MTPILNQQDFGDRRFISVCANCLPGRSLFDLYPWLRDNVEISHGICPEHKAEFLRQLRQPRRQAA